ncbi:MAG: hypothetical protein HQL17_03235 [Candidatus Omnitrophica bacterium]|nr:hypothetical protein [Candidatus Omnitrophota bacterium]
MKNLLLPLSLIFAFNIVALPAGAAVITFKDLSTINGEVVSMENGVYTINTPNVGQIKVPSQNISSISGAVQSAKPADNNIKSLPEFQTIQNKIASNPQAMADIQKLLEDPEVMAIMSDPSFITAVQSGNINTLQTDPRLKRLSENPKIQALMHSIDAGK